MNDASCVSKAIVFLAVTGWFAFTAGNVAVAQQSTDQHAQHRPGVADTSQPDLQAELESLRGKVSALEIALQKQHQSHYGTDLGTQPGAMQQGSMTKQPMSGMGMKSTPAAKGMAGMGQNAGGQEMAGMGM